MKMHEDSSLQSRKNLREYPLHIAAGLADMRRIDEQDISVFEFLEKRYPNILKRPRNQPREAWNAVVKILPRIRFNTGKVGSLGACLSR